MILYCLISFNLKFILLTFFVDFKKHLGFDFYLMAIASIQVSFRNRTHFLPTQNSSILSLFTHLAGHNYGKHNPLFQRPLIFLNNSIALGKGARNALKLLFLTQRTLLQLMYSSKVPLCSAGQQYRYVYKPAILPSQRPI